MVPQVVPSPGLRGSFGGRAIEAALWSSAVEMVAFERVDNRRVYNGLYIYICIAVNYDHLYMYIYTGYIVVNNNLTNLDYVLVYVSIC